MYVLVTPAKNEEQNLPIVIESVVNQDCPPLAWFIVDDCSTDGTPAILRSAAREYVWIHVHTLSQKSEYDLGEHYAYVCKTGFDAALQLYEHQIRYVALADADTYFPPSYFGEIIAFMEQNPQYGIVSGRIEIGRPGIGKPYQEEPILYGEGTPKGTGRVWRLEAFKETSGYLVVKSPDVVSNVLAQLKGWQLRQLKHVVCYQLRDTASKHGLFRGYFQRGQRAYYLGYNLLSPINMFLGSLVTKEKKAFIKSLAFTAGYLESYLRRRERIPLKQVRQYLGSYRQSVYRYYIFARHLRRIAGK